MSLRGWMAAGRRTLSGFLVFVMTAILILGNTQFTFAGETSERFFEGESSLTDGGGYSIATVSNAKFKNEEKQGLVISVFSEDSDFRAGGDVVLDVHIKNDTGSVISDGSLWARARGSEDDSAYFEEIEDSIVYAGDITGGDEESLIDDSADIELELDIDPAAEAASSRKAQKTPDAESESLEDEDEEEKLEKITGIDLAPGEVYSARYHFVIAEGLEKTKNQSVKFYFTGEDEDEKKIHENEDFLYTVNYLNLDTVLFEESNRVYTGEEITMGIHSFMYDFDALLWDSFVDTVATPSDATPSDATPSNAAVATPSNAAVPYEYDEDSDTYIVDLEDTSYTIQMINARLNGFEVRKALVNDANENMLVCTYRVSRSVEPGIYFGKITQESKSGAKTFRSTQGFALIVEGDGEITLEGQVGDTIVTVTGPADSFPEADQLALRVTGIGSDVQELVETAIRKRAEEDGFSVNGYQALDVRLYADGEEVEPDGSLEITFKNVETVKKNFIEKAVETVAETVSDAVKSVLNFFGFGGDSEAEDTTDAAEKVRITELRRVYHYEEETGTADEVAAIETEDGDLLIETDGLSVYVVADIAPNDTILTATDNQDVKVTVQGNLPVEANLKITRLEKQDLDDLEDKLTDNGIKPEGIWQFGYDINVGEQDSFEEPVTVTVSNFNLGYYNYDNLCVKVYHVHDGEAEVINGATITKEGITFQTNSFSAYYLDVDAVEDREEVANSIAEPGPEIYQYLYPEQYEGWEDFDWDSWCNEFAADEEVAEISESSDEEETAVNLAEEANVAAGAYSSGLTRTARVAATGELSDSQITDSGGESFIDEDKDGVSDDDVKVSKTIDGTDVENVFDITLEVTTTTSVSEIMKEPDMAVVLVLDISNTMRQVIGTTSSDYGTEIYDNSRYAVAIGAAENFLDTFAANTSGLSKVGFVAYNTNSTQIFPLSSCADSSEASQLKTTMRSGTRAILETSGYSTGWSKYTNMESGLKRAKTMLANATNENKYIIFLTDGMPTTYVKSGYTGYEPHSTGGTPGQDGVFYDNATGYYCAYGTSYSDKAAIRAREMATSIKTQDITIFSIGVDVGTNTIKGYERTGLSVIDRTCNAANKTKNSSYEIGSYNSAEAFENWLKGTANGSSSTGIGSGYYYSASDTSGLEEAYADIFKKIIEMNAASAAAKWVATDPMPTVPSGSTVSSVMEFLGFYDKDGTYKVYEPNDSLTGEDGLEKENTAGYNSSTNSISWDLKNSGYTATTSGSTTWYTYTLTYRVRLKNEIDGFASEDSYKTNGKTSLTYEVATTTSGTTSYVEKTVDFKYPEVKGYLGEFDFTKVDDGGIAVEGAVFTLTHDTTTCNVCRGDETSSVTISDFTATSGTDGKVEFTNIPSGHTYTLTETSAPTGYIGDPTTYTVTVAMGKTEVATMTNGKIVNTRTVSVKVEKKWEDNNNSDNSRPSSVSVTLYDGDGNEVKKDADNNSIYNPVTLSQGSDDWTYKWENLNAYDSDHREISYTVQEDAATWLYSDTNTNGWYTGLVTGNMTEGYTITNTYRPVTTEITVQKNWDDSNNQFSLRPDSITVYLYQAEEGSTASTTKNTRTLSESDIIDPDTGYWAYTWSDLPQYYFKDTNSDGIPEKYKYTYSADEDTNFTNHEHYYTPVITTADGTITITNTLMTAKLQLEKIVIDGEGGEGTDEAPYKFQIRLLGSNGNIYTAVALANGENSGIIWLTPTEDGLTYTIIEVVPMEYKLVDMGREEKADSGDFTTASVFNPAGDINGSTITVYPGDYAYVTLTNQPSHDTYFHRTESVTNHWTEAGGFTTDDDVDLYEEEPERDTTGSGSSDSGGSTENVTVAALFENQRNKKSQKDMKEGDELRG